MKLDQAGIDFIQSFESYSATPYQDQHGVWTIGWGHTEGVTAQTLAITRDDALLLFEEDIEIAEHTVDSAVLVQITQNEFDALVSFTFNEGSEAFLKSTLLKMLNNGDKQGAAKQFDRWIYYKDPVSTEMKISNGLKARRAEEKSLFLEDFQTRRAILPRDSLI